MSPEPDKPLDPKPIPTSRLSFLLHLDLVPGHLTTIIRNQISILMLVTSAISLCYIIRLVGVVFPQLYQRTFQLHTETEARIFWHTPTRFAVDHPWFFAIAICLSTFATIALLQRRKNQAIQYTALGLSAQGTIFWAGMFCYSFDGFLGPMSLHQDSEFELLQFVKFGFGVFPVTLVALLTTFFGALWDCKKSGEKRLLEEPH